MGRINQEDECVGVCVCVCMRFPDYANISWTLAERWKQQRQLWPKVLANRNLTHGEFLMSRYVRTLAASPTLLHLQFCRNASDLTVTPVKAEWNRRLTGRTVLLLHWLTRIIWAARAAEMSFLRGGRTRGKKHRYLRGPLTQTSTRCQEEPVE